jgi:hypothetical protein
MIRAATNEPRAILPVIRLRPLSEVLLTSHLHRISGKPTRRRPLHWSGKWPRFAQSPSANNSIKINRSQMTRRSVLRQNDANRAYPSAFIRGSVFLGGLGGKERFQPPMNADGLRTRAFPGKVCQIGFAVVYQRGDPGRTLRPRFIGMDINGDGERNFSTVLRIQALSKYFGQPWPGATVQDLGSSGAGCVNGNAVTACFRSHKTASRSRGLCRRDIA